MKKISTLYLKDKSDLSKVTRVVDPENEWVLTGYGIATRKFDGTSTAIIDGVMYKRFDAKLKITKRGKTKWITIDEAKKKLPFGAIACQEPDKITGHWPHWIPCLRDDNSNKYHFEAYDKYISDNGIIVDGTYELCGEKIQGNPEKIDGHQLIKHGSEILRVPYLTYDAFETYLEKHDIEGIVFHHIEDGRMCKIRKVDFGIKR